VNLDEENCNSYLVNTVTRTVKVESQNYSYDRIWNNSSK